MQDFLQQLSYDRRISESFVEQFRIQNRLHETQVLGGLFTNLEQTPAQARRNNFNEHVGQRLKIRESLQDLSILIITHRFRVLDRLLSEHRLDFCTEDETKTNQKLREIQRETVEAAYNARLGRAAQPERALQHQETLLEEEALDDLEGARFELKITKQTVEGGTSERATALCRAISEIGRRTDLGLAERQVLVEREALRALEYRVERCVLSEEPPRGSPGSQGPPGTQGPQGSQGDFESEVSLKLDGFSQEEKRALTREIDEKFAAWKRDSARDYLNFEAFE